MNIKILNKKENILLSRIEAEAEILFEKKPTPSAEEVKSALSKELEVEKNLIAVKRIDSTFGNGKAKVTAYQYFSKEEMDKIEPKAKKPAEAAKEEKKEEAPKEKKKKEPKEEKKE